MLIAADLPDDIAAPKAMPITADARNARKDERIERLEKQVPGFKQAAIGRRSETSDPDQLELPPEDLAIAIAALHVTEEADTPDARRAS